MSTKRGRDEGLIAPHMCLGFSSRYALVESRVGQNYVKGGGLLQRTSSSPQEDYIQRFNNFCAYLTSLWDLVIVIELYGFTCIPVLLVGHDSLI